MKGLCFGHYAFSLRKTLPVNLAFLSFLQTSRHHHRLSWGLCSGSFLLCVQSLMCGSCCPRLLLRVEEQAPCPASPESSTWGFRDRQQAPLTSGVQPCLRLFSTVSNAIEQPGKMTKKRGLFWLTILVQGREATSDDGLLAGTVSGCWVSHGEGWSTREP